MNPKVIWNELDMAYTLSHDKIPGFSLPSDYQERNYLTLRWYGSQSFPKSLINSFTVRLTTRILICNCTYSIPCFTSILRILIQKQRFADVALDVILIHCMQTTAFSAQVIILLVSVTIVFPER